MKMPLWSKNSMDVSFLPSALLRNVDRKLFTDVSGHLSVSSSRVKNFKKIVCP